MTKVIAVYMLLDEISQLFTKDGLSVVRILTRKAQNEHLSVLKVIK